MQFWNLPSFLLISCITFCFLQLLSHLAGGGIEVNLEEDSLEDMPNDMTSEGMTSWIKLNIYGIGTKGDQPGRYSGVFEDETGTFLGRYKGAIDVEDDLIAGLEALRHGLVRCMKGKPNAQKLLVESDNVILVQYVNRRPEPNKITMDRLKEIFDLLERLLCIVALIYEEANETARDWALRDECPTSELIYLCFSLKGNLMNTISSSKVSDRGYLGCLKTVDLVIVIAKLADFVLSSDLIDIIDL
ncbi:uncharacterized protein [Nicotiana sylvestris]|uniref:uncharacterized protein isoform X2 n=1 Tax=Nicotiana sylvestris TaxID=4096 RepID=UPI00388C4B86